MATKRITKDEYVNAYNILNARTNSTLNNALTKLEKKHLYDFLIDDERGEINEPFIKTVFDNDTTFMQAVQDPKYTLPRIFNFNEEKFIKNKFKLKNSLSRVALTRVVTRFPKVANIRLSFSTGLQPLRHCVLGR